MDIATKPGGQIIEPALDAKGDDEIDIRQYWHTIMRHKWGILGFALVLSLLAVIVVFSIKPVYEASTTILIESESAKVVSIEEVYGVGSAKREYFQTQFEILKSRDLAKKVIQKLNLRKHPEFDPDQQEQTFRIDWRAMLSKSLFPDTDAKVATEEEILNTIVTRFQKQMEVSPVRYSQLAHVKFESHSPELSAQIVNTLADMFIENELEAKMAMTEKATAWLTQRLDGLREKLEVSEKELQAFREKEKLVDVKGVRSISAKKLDQFSEKLATARAERAMAQNLFRQVKAAGGNLNDINTIPAILEHPVIQKLKEVEVETERKVSELSRRYGDKHPKMVAAKQELNTTRSKLQREVRRIIQGLEKKYQVALQNEREIARVMEENKGEAQQINRKEYELGVLQREVNANRQLYDLFLNRLKETDSSSDIQSAHARVVDTAVTPTVPSKPKKSLIVAITFVLSLFIGVLIAFLHDHLDNTLKNSADVEMATGLAVLGVLPLLKLKRKQRGEARSAFIHSPNTVFGESMRTIRTGVMLSALDDPHKIVAVTSSIPGEGKTTVAMSLAFALGQMEKVLLVDADMRRPSIMQALGFKKDLPGLSNLVAGTEELGECVQRIPDTEVDVIGSGVVPPNPLEMLSSTRFHDLIGGLSETYDRVIIDTAPTLAVSDALVLSKTAKAMIYVVKADATNFPLIQDGLKRLNKVGAPLIGAVLNQFDAKKSSKYGGYSKYGNYSGDYSYQQYGDYSQSYGENYKPTSS